MSVELMSMVWKRLDVSGGELILALSLADFSNNQGESIFPSVKTLCDTTRQSRSTVQRQLARFREVGWLQVVGAGGLIGGREKTTEYRINPEWVKGVNLTGFPDVVRDETSEIKGVNLTGFPDKGPDLQHERAPSESVKGLTAVTHDPSLTTKNLGGADATPATPSGPRGAAPKPEPKPKGALSQPPARFDEHVSRGRWWRHAVGYVLPAASVLDIIPPRTLRLEDVSNIYTRSTLTDACREITAWAVTEHAKAWPDDTDRRLVHITEEIESRLKRMLGDITPTPAAKRAEEAAA